MLTALRFFGKLNLLGNFLDQKNLIMVSLVKEKFHFFILPTVLCLREISEILTILVIYDLVNLLFTNNIKRLHQCDASLLSVAS